MNGTQSQKNTGKRPFAAVFMLPRKVFLVVPMSSALTAAKAKGAGRDIFGSWWGIVARSSPLEKQKMPAVNSFDLPQPKLSCNKAVLGV